MYALLIILYFSAIGLHAAIQVNGEAFIRAKPVDRVKMGFLLRSENFKYQNQHFRFRLDHDLRNDHYIRYRLDLYAMGLCRCITGKKLVYSREMELDFMSHAADLSALNNKKLVTLIKEKIL